MLVGAWITQAIYVAAELGIADLLVEKPLTAEELAKRAGAHANSLYRVLRALGSIGIFAEDEHGRFSLTPLAEHLRSDRADLHKSFAVMMGAEFYQSWGNLLHAVKTGNEAFRKTFGVTFFQYMTEHPDRHKIYDAAMEGFAVAETEPMIDAYDFSRFETVIDVGGGNGLVLASILRRHPAVKGILFDLPPVADRARTIFSGLNLDGRCRIVGGDFFSSVPEGANAYVLRHIIHDWDDDDAVKILRNCQEAMNPEGRVLVAEIAIPRGNSPCFGKWLDLMMLVVGGRERTEEQYRRLFSEAGLKLNRIVPTATEVSVLEAVRS
ncbi:MAG: methyltransferase [Candidatus Abyssobacteria bacterium SURF_5]|uniref:Methyltransferase n=1 Tax=Abyssobacteria bacterium (strain SURF_5) TaxID=2093360 RepID=A0A3A4P962_ABYX5|nr:MAG: methyltransferase [Candidatus Abyssubacteria bacterium SURF_5]